MLWTYCRFTGLVNSGRSSDISNLRLREHCNPEGAQIPFDDILDRVTGYAAQNLVREYLRASHRHRPIIPLWLPGKAARVVRDGANLALDRAVGRRTWEEFLAERIRPGATARAT